ncbi:MAG: hypothetical protein WDO15_10065 [Bacteroidota bacterium]
MMFDSLVTGDAPRLLVGYHEDEDLGKISASAYFQLSTQGLFEVDKLTATFSRVELRLVSRWLFLLRTQLHRSPSMFIS